MPFAGCARKLPPIVKATPGCPEPPQAPINPAWPEVFVGVAGCSDAGAGTRAQPFCTFGKAFEVARAAPWVVTVLDGTYRLVDHFPSVDTTLLRAGTADAYFTIRADAGARPILLGSRPIAGASFVDLGGGLWRAPVDALPIGPRGLWTSGGTLLVHEMQWKSGVRSHADASALTQPGTWTKADANGAGCGDANTGCYVYVRAASGMNVPATDFEASQRGFFFAASSHYMRIEGLSFRFTHSTSIFFEGANHLLIQDNELAHNANSDDNAYSIRIWNAEGGMVRRNRVYDSRYWGGATNSWGITFMLSGREEPVWVCENDISDIVWAGIGAKGGASNIQVVGNRLHDLHIGVYLPGSRCDWRGCDYGLWDGGGYAIRENVFERCDEGVYVAEIEERPEAVVPSRIYNNLFVDTLHGIGIGRESPTPWVRSNVFAGGREGLYLHAGGTTTWGDHWLSRGLDSDYNLFRGTYAVYVEANWSGTERGFTLDEYRAQYKRYTPEAHSIALDPKLGAPPPYTPSADSPVWGAGDAAPYTGATSVPMGPWVP